MGLQRLTRAPFGYADEYTGAAKGEPDFSAGG